MLCNMFKNKKEKGYYLIENILRGSEDVETNIDYLIFSEKSDLDAHIKNMNLIYDNYSYNLDTFNLNVKNDTFYILHRTLIFKDNVKSVIDISNDKVDLNVILEREFKLDTDTFDCEILHKNSDSYKIWKSDQIIECSILKFKVN